MFALFLFEKQNFPAHKSILLAKEIFFFFPKAIQTIITSLGCLPEGVTSCNPDWPIIDAVLSHPLRYLLFILGFYQTHTCTQLLSHLQIACKNQLLYRHFSIFSIVWQEVYFRISHYLFFSFCGINILKLLLLKTYMK